MRCAVLVAICLVQAASAPVHAEDWGVRRDPFDVGVVGRYKAILTRDPHDAGALRELVAMYRRYRSIDKLEAEYRTQLGAGEDWATLVVLARLPQRSGDAVTALWTRATRARPEDAPSWLALGNALDATGQASQAQDAFEHAVQHAKTPKLKRAALDKVIAIARAKGNHAAVDAGYAQLVTLAPKDGGLWLARGDAQLIAERHDAALTSFATAEKLFATDPERRLVAMTNQGLALARMGRHGDAIAQYERTLDKVPRGYFLGRELIPRIVDAHRQRGGVADAIAALDKRWPERTRGHFEWATLAALHQEAGNAADALAAYQRAVAKAPTEIESQRKLIKMLDDARRHGDALAAHEAAARIAPGDADLQLELAKRYQPTSITKALATLDRLARRLPNNVNVRRSIAELYTRWDRPGRALKEYEAIVRLEPKDPDHVVVLGDAYWTAGNETKALATWQRLERIATAVSHRRHGEVLAMHELWEDAAAAYGKSLALDDRNPETWRERARIHDVLDRYEAAVTDAERAVALIGHATLEAGHRERYLLVRILGRWHEHEDPDTSHLHDALARWRFAFDHGDVKAGYLLVEHHARLISHQHEEVLVALYKRVPSDDSLGIALARVYRNKKEFDRGIEELQRIRHRRPARREELTKLIGDFEADKLRWERKERWEEEGIPDPDLDISSHRRIEGPDLVGKKKRLAIRASVGTDVRGAPNALLGIGTQQTWRLARGLAAVNRMDWQRREGHMENVDVFALGLGLTARVINARTFELAAGIAQRAELRFGNEGERAPWDKLGLAADLVVEYMPRALPATIGARFEQMISDDARSSALLLELAFELR